jgi:uncharacterized membrane protein YedE/YeeE
MMAMILALTSGVLFGVGLTVSGMTNPANVIAFLDVTGAWNPALAFVMVGAIAVHAPLYFLIRKRSAPWCAREFVVRKDSALTPSLVIGSALFGIGWGLGGYCPGPALVATAASHFRGHAAWFTLSMLVGMKLTALARGRITQFMAPSSAQRSAPSSVTGGERPTATDDIASDTCG